MGLEGGEPSRTLSHVIKGAFSLIASHFALFSLVIFLLLLDVLLPRVYCALVREL